MDVVRVMTVELGRDPRDTEPSSHCKVGYHRDSQNQCREPTLTASVSCRLLTRDGGLGKVHAPVEDPCLSLDPEREDEYTDETNGEQGKHDPEGSVARIGRMQESDFGVRL